MLFQKLPYYITSAATILLQLKNPFSLVGYIERRETVLRFRNGLVFKTLQPIDALIIKETVFDNTYLINNLTDDPSLIIDVGAGLGDFTILAAKTYSSAQVLAFEPLTNEYDLLKQNIRLNRASNIKTFNVAIGTQTKYTFYPAKANVQSSIIQDLQTTDQIMVHGKRLDDFIEKPVDILKIDCEGAEIDVLKSISRTKMRLIRLIILEYHNHLVENEDLRLLNMLKELKFYLIKKQDSYNPKIGYIYAINTHVSMAL
jgi:FkbM family methyltransferase